MRQAAVSCLVLAIAALFGAGTWAASSEPPVMEPELLQPSIVPLEIDPWGREARVCVVDQDGQPVVAYHWLNIDVRWAGGPEAGSPPTTVGVGYDGHQTWSGGSAWAHIATSSSGCRTVRVFNPHGATDPVLLSARIVATAGQAPPVPVVSQTVQVDLDNVAG